MQHLLYLFQALMFVDQRLDLGRVELSLLQAVRRPRDEKAKLRGPKCRRPHQA